MIITDTDLRTLHPLNNSVIVTPAVDTSKYGSLHIVQSDDFQKAPIICTIIAAPRRLTCAKHTVAHETIEEIDAPPEIKALMYERRQRLQFSETTMVEKPVRGSMAWKTPVQVRTGDTVWLSANAITLAESRGNVVYAGSKPYYFIPYESLYLKKDGNKVTMLNGYVLAERVLNDDEWMKRAEKSGIIIPNVLRTMKNDDRYGIVRYIGDPVEYLLNDRFDHPGIKMGDTVMFRFRANRRLEPGLKFFAKDGTDLIVTRRCYLLAIM